MGKSHHLVRSMCAMTSSLNLILIGVAGFPAIIEKAGGFFVTIEFAPTITPFGINTPCSITELSPTQTSLPILVVFCFGVSALDPILFKSSHGECFH